MKKANQQKLNKFIQQIVNTKIITIQLLPALTVDTTAVPTLRSLFQQTQLDQTQDGRILNLTSQKLLNFFDKIQQQHQSKREVPLNSNRIKFQQMVKQKDKIVKPTIHLKNREVSNQYVTQNYNDQNKNTINIQEKANIPQSYKIKNNNFDEKLVQIIRPQYKKKNTAKPIKQKGFQTAFPTSKSNRTYITQQQDSQQIPIVKNGKRKIIELKKDARRSISPKHQHSKQQISNLSFISKNYQTQTDHSFQIDLHSLGIVPQYRKKYQKSQYLLNEKQDNRESKRANEEMSKFKKALKGQIQEQQPWQCDQQEIEEQIREINQRLSHRAYNRQRAKTQYDIAKCQMKHQENQYAQYIYQQPRKKQTKTVRLNLTPIRNKSTARSQGNKKQAAKTPNNKTPIDLKKGIQNKYQAVEIQQRFESPAEVECSKWKKPQKGLISLQIQKKMRNR